MRFTLCSMVAVAASVVSVSAQTPDYSILPTCAVPCFATAVQSSGCAITDSKCQCTTGFNKISSDVLSCLPGKCSADDITKVSSAVVQLCASQGVTLTSIPTALPTMSGTGSVASRLASLTASAASTASAAQAATSSPAAANANIAGMGGLFFGVALAML